MSCLSFGGARWAVPAGILGEKPLLPAEPFLPALRSSRKLSSTERLVPFFQVYLNSEPSSRNFFFLFSFFFFFFEVTSTIAIKQEEGLGSGQGFRLAACLLGYWS